MLYLLAFVLPPVAVLFTGHPMGALLNLGLCVLGFVPGIVHALLVVSDYKAEKRVEKYGT